VTHDPPGHFSVLVPDDIGQSKQNDGEEKNQQERQADLPEQLIGNMKKVNII
jgi:hypothetical protein